MTIWAVDQWDNPYVRDPYTLPRDQNVDLQANQYVGQSLIDQFQCTQDYMSRFSEADISSGGRNDTASSAAATAASAAGGGADRDDYRAAFWTLFKWSPLILHGTERLRRELGLVGGGGGSGNSTAGGGRTDRSSDYYPYVAIHLRTGNLGHTGDVLLVQTANESAWPDYYRCAKALQAGLRERVRAV
jgi:hypothetical protein